jgi:hypothetical protein
MVRDVLRLLAKDFLLIHRVAAIPILLLYALLFVSRTELDLGHTARLYWDGGLTLACASVIAVPLHRHWILGTMKESLAIPRIAAHFLCLLPALLVWHIFQVAVAYSLIYGSKSLLSLAPFLIAALANMGLLHLWLLLPAVAAGRPLRPVDTWKNSTDFLPVFAGLSISMTPSLLLWIWSSRLATRVELLIACAVLPLQVAILGAVLSVLYLRREERATTSPDTPQGEAALDAKDVSA